MGAYHGIEGFRSMSHVKGIYVLGAVERVRSHARAVRAGSECDPVDDAAVVEIRISSCERPGEIFTAPHNWVGGDKPFATATATHRRRK
jgi:hypothetical protein